MPISKLKKHCVESPKYREDFSERLQLELKTIEKFNVAENFLKLKKVINFLNKENVTIGTAKAITNSSLVNYLLGATNINPLDFGLLFQRYLNDRITTPYFGLNISCYNFEQSNIYKLYFENLEIHENMAIEFISKYWKKEYEKDTFNVKKWDFIELNWINSFFIGALNISESFYNNFIKELLYKAQPTNLYELINCLVFKHQSLANYYETISFDFLEKIYFQEDWLLYVSKQAEISLEEAVKVYNKLVKDEIKYDDFSKLFINLSSVEIRHLFSLQQYLANKANILSDAIILKTLNEINLNLIH